MKYIFMIIAIIVLFFYTAASAATPHLLIAQVSASGVTADDEFILLQNPTDQSVDLGSWSIQYKSVNGSTYYKKNFVKGASVAAGGTYLIAGSGYAGNLNPDMKQSTISLSSAGGTVFVVADQNLLTTNDSPSIVDQKTYAADNSKTTSNTPPTNDQEVNTNNNAIIDAADNASDEPSTTSLSETTTSTNAAVAKRDDINLITINEFMPAPTDGKEWVELFDGTGYAVDLSNWTMTDGTGHSFATLDGLIMPRQFKLIELSSSHLNNAGDLIILRDDQKREIDSVAYGDWNSDPSNAPAGGADIATARIGDGCDTNDDQADFVLTSTPTPGTGNIVTVPTTNDERLTANEKTTPSLSTKIPKTDPQWLAALLKTQAPDLAKLLSAGNIIIIENLTINDGATAAAITTSPTTKNTKTTVTTGVLKTATTQGSEPRPTAGPTTTKTPKTKPVKAADVVAGMVIVPPNVVGKDLCVVREDDRSVEVRLPKDLKNTPIAGDIVAASGAWSTAQTLTLPRLLVSKATAFTINDHDTPPEPISVPMSDLDDHIGELIATTGTIVEKQPTRLRIADGATALLIKTNFSANKGDRLAATGLLVKSGADLLLTALADNALSITKPPTAAATSPLQRSLAYALALVPAGVLIAAVSFGKRLKKKGGESQ